MKFPFLITCGVLFAEATDAATATPAEASAAAPAKEEKPAKPPKDQKNGVTRPSAGTQTGKVWDIADRISQTENRPAKRSEVLEAGKKENINPATITTQYGQWRRYWGIKKEAVAEAPAADKPETAKQRKAREKAEAAAAAGTGASQADLDASNKRSEQAIADQQAADAAEGSVE